MKNSSFGSLRTGKTPEAGARLFVDIILPPEPPALPSFFGLFEASSKVISPPTGTARSGFGNISGCKTVFLPCLWCDGNISSSVVSAGEILIYGL